MRDACQCWLLAIFDLTDNIKLCEAPVFQQAASRNGPRGQLGSRIHLPNTVILPESPVVEGHRIESRTPHLARPIFQRSCRVPIPYLAAYLGLQTYRMLGRRNKVGPTREARSPTRTFPRGSTDDGSMQRAGARETRTCLWGGGGEGGRVAEFLRQPHPSKLRAHRNVHPTPLLVMLRGRGPGNQPGHRGRGHWAFGERVDLRPHRLRRQLPVVCISCRRHAKGPQNFDGATQPASLCLRKQLGHYIHTTRARTYTARESVHSPPRADCWREALPKSCCRRLSCRAVRSRFRGP